MAVEIPNTIHGIPNSSPKYIGKTIDRVEDPALLTGQTEFIDNLTFSGMLHCAILRSPHAHAKILSINTDAAEALAGVAAVVTGEDAKRWTNPMPTVPEGWGGYVLATDKVRFVGEPVVAVAAVSRYVAEDALELIEVEYEALPAAVDAHAAAQSGSPLIFEEQGTNVMMQRVFTWGEVDQAFASAAKTYTESFRWNRLGANPLETFGCVGQWNLVDGTVTFHASVQSQSHMALSRSAILGIPSNKVRMVSQPHGGSFGGKGGFRGCDIVAILSRKSEGRPVKWIEDRIEYLSGGAGQAWDRHYEVSLAVSNEGKVEGLRVKLLDDLGATAEAFGAVSAAKPLAAFTGCYAIPVAEYDLTLVATNKLPGSPYRGMGPPPHNYVLEQMMDIVAADLGIDPAEIRRRNYIPADAFPYVIASGNEYDSGNYELALDTALEMGAYAELRKEQEQARADGRHLGIGLVNTIEPGVFDWNAYAIVGVQGTGVPEGLTLGIDVLGGITAKIGFSLEGQGQYTVITQVLADYFNVDSDAIRVVYQDSLSAPPHFGPGGSRLGVAITGAALGAARILSEKLCRVGSVLLQTDFENVEFMDGMVRVKEMPEAAIPFTDVAAAMLARSDLLPPGIDPSPTATYVWTAEGRTPVDDQGRAKSYLTAANACHLVLVEVDTETGMVEILKYFIADDCGTRLNPAMVEGMTQGGVAQGVGAALLEEYCYDDEGQLLTSTFMDYLMPTVHEVPMTEKKALVTPSPFTPLGAKGVGEAAMHTTPAAVMCAINDALRPLGTSVYAVPASPKRIWSALENLRQDTD